MRSLSVVFLVLAPFALAATPRPHPRVEVTPALIEQLRSLRDRDDPAWTRLERWVASAPRGRGPNVVLGCMLSYLVTNDRRQFDCGWDAVHRTIYRNGADRGGGLMPILDLYNGNKHQAAFQGGVLLGVIAHFYDWGYAGLCTRTTAGHHRMAEYDDTLRARGVPRGRLVHAQ